MHRILPLVLACFVFAGCAHKTKNTPPESVDFVALTLGQAAEEAHSDLAMLAHLRGQGLQPLFPPPDARLAERMSISWTGPAEGALKQICLNVGYRYVEMGTPSAQEISVVVHGLDKTAQELLEDIAWQIQPQAVLRLDPLNRSLTLARTQGANS
ncbi:MAG: DotD/TraH family lipoprotein [Desulfovibrio sp.]